MLGSSSGMVMRVLITGSEGFVGSHLKAYLAERGFQVIPFDLKRGDDVTDRRRVEEIFGGVRPDYVIHLAWIVDKRRADADPYESFKVGVMGTANLLEAASRSGVKRFLFMNSGQVYGNCSGRVREDSPLMPENAYARSKVCALHLIKQYGASRALPYTVLTSWELFGEGAPEQTITTRIIRHALRDEPITLYCFGEQRFDINYVGNVCHAFELALMKEHASNEVFNVGSGRVVTLKELTNLILELTGSRSRVDLKPPREGEKLWDSHPALDKIRRVLGYSPAFSLEEGLTRTIDFLRRRL